MQAQNAKAAGVSLLLVANNGPGGYIRMDPDPGAAAPGIPVFAVPLSTYTLLAAQLQGGTALNMKLQPHSPPTGKLPIPGTQLERRAE